MLSVVIPMAGEGRRFAEAGYDKPKPRIDIAGLPMIERVMASLVPKEPHGFQLLSRERVGETRGAVDTLLHAHLDGETLVANCDQYLVGGIDPFLKAVRDFPAGVMTFNSTNPHHSYVKLHDGFVTEIAEKRVISDNAVFGIYWFAEGRTLAGYCRSVLDTASDDELYLSAVLNEYLRAGEQIAAFEVDVHDKHILGTPEELAIFLDKVADGRVVL